VKDDGMKKFNFIIWLMAFLFVTQQQTAVAQPTQQTTNLLENGGMERPYTSGVANGWQCWYWNDTTNIKDEACLNGYHFKPKWNIQAGDNNLIQSGGSSQYNGNNWDTWAGGIWQTVDVTVGSTYRFSFYARVRGTNEESPAPSEGTLQANVRAGIDPNGSGNWADSDVVWSGSGSPHDSWQQFTVETTATSDEVTVFTHANWGVQGINQCRQFLDVWFDSAELVEAGPPATNTPVPLPPTNTPIPVTNTPVPPSPTATPNIPPTDTPMPTDTPTPTATPIIGGIVCVNAFADENANGVRDEAEGFIGGVTFQVGNLQEIVGQAVSTGDAEPICFPGIEPGSYQVTQILPPRLQMTTAPNTTINVEANKTYGVEFGSRLTDVVSNSGTSSPDTISSNVEVPTIAPTTNTDTAQPDEGGFSLAEFSGLFILLLAVIVVGVLLFIVLRRQRG
jgi:hypothetical protein